MKYPFEMKVAALCLCAVVTVACQSGTQSPVSPSAVLGGTAALNADGSNLKVDAPLAVSPLFEATNISTTPTLAARGSRGKFETAVTLSHRFQVAESDNFANIVASGAGVTDASGVTRWTVDPPLANNKRYVWRVRAENGDAFGPWSNTMAFSTLTAVAAATPTTTPTTPTTTAGPRPADPPPGSRLPLPDFRHVLARFADARDSCPRGIKYVNNPWQDRVIDAFRQLDSRWGYNG
ncbi:MAG TPA: hypothetical protein VEC39_13040, partial [Vicinamibacterales bacterium]|nr:hypothetical protein [Vicinamibacterales bacterium]